MTTTQPDQHDEIVDWALDDDHRRAVLRNIASGGLPIRHELAGGNLIDVIADYIRTLSVELVALIDEQEKSR